MTSPERNGGADEHGDVFERGWGSMFIHVQRESGLAHRTLVLRPWQVQALRLVVSRWFAAVIAVALLSWGYFALQTARVPLLTRRITHLEQDAEKIDTLQATLEQLQRRYSQVQQMLSASARSVPPGSPAATPATASVAKPVQAPVQAPGPAKPAPVAPRAADSTAAKQAPVQKKASDTTAAKSAPAKVVPPKPAPAKPAPAKSAPVDTTSTKPSPSKNIKPRPDTAAKPASVAAQ